MMKMKRILSLAILTVLLVSGILTAPGQGFLFESYAAAIALKTPTPYQSGDYEVSWDHIAHADSYEVRLTMKSELEEKSVSRTLTVTACKADIRLFAADCTVSVSVRAVPATSASSKYKASSWGRCGDTFYPMEENTVCGYAGVEGKRFFMTDLNGTKMTGWKQVNKVWYYFDPNNNGLTPLGWANINGADYYFGSSGQMMTGWVTVNGYQYYLDPDSGKMATGWVQVTPTQKKYFTESESQGQPRGSLKEEGSNPGASAGTGTVTNQWRRNPDGSWSYYKDGNMIRNAWADIDGFTYYFDSNGIMLIGWQFINSRWYYLEPYESGSNGYKHGAMWRNATTPDGYTVNADGCWVRDGVVVTEKGSGTSSKSSGSKTSNAKTTCKLNITAVDMGAGKVKNASVTNASNCTIKSQSFSKPYEQWEPGDTITITVELEAKSGFTFSSSTEYSCSGGTLVSQSGSETARTVKLSYTTVLRLSAPSAIYVTDANELKWVPVNRAVRYRVKISTPDNGNSTTQTITGTTLDLLEYGNPEVDRMSIEITAMGPKNIKYIQDSEKATINDVTEYRQTHTINGTLEKSQGRLRYRDENGSPIRGWQQVLGNWYHFNQNGFADGPGWFQDESGYWYYFNEEYQMLTGKISIGGTKYFLNDGSVNEAPLGAWIQ